MSETYEAFEEDDALYFVKPNHKQYFSTLITRKQRCRAAELIIYKGRTIKSFRFSDGDNAKLFAEFFEGKTL